MVTVPFSEFPAFTEEIVLDNVPYRFSFNWNTRGKFFTLIISDRDQVELLSGIKLVINFELLRWYPGRGTPPGELYVVDPSGELERVERNSFQDKLSLIYVGEAEVATL